MEGIMKFVLLLSLVFCQFVFAQDAELSKKVNLLICTEKAPILCPYFNLTKEKAMRRVNMLCSGSPIGNYRITGEWKKDKIVGVRCFVDEPEVSNQSCQAAGYDCASVKDNICVDHGQVKSDYVGSNDPAFLRAQTLVTINPTFITSFPQYFYACK